MSSSTIAPTVATRIDHTLNPVAPVPPKIPNTKPPTTAPTIPIMAVTIMPPGSSPGSTSLASAPAINPTTIQLMMPIFSLALLSEGLSLLLGVDSTIIYVGVLVKSGVVGRLLAPAVTVCSTGVYISQCSILSTHIRALQRLGDVLAVRQRDLDPVAHGLLYHRRKLLKRVGVG